MNKKGICFLAGVISLCGCCLEPPRAESPVGPTVRGNECPELQSQWKGKKVAFLGDSITDRIHVGCTKNYWNFLAEILGVDAYVYGKIGWRMDGVLKQAESLSREVGSEIDAIFVWAGTNDYNGSVPRGSWYETNDEDVMRSTGMARLSRRKVSLDEKTFRGRINRLLSYLKHAFPRQQIVLVTALHRGYATFGPKNIQPDETFPNLLGDYIDDYNDDIRMAGRIWSVPVLDLYEKSGLLPNEDAHICYFHDGRTDRIHPNTNGHLRLAKTMAYWMISIPSDFKD